MNHTELDRRKYHIVRYNFRTRKLIEVYPYYITGHAVAEWKVDELNRALPKDSVEAGERWHIEKGTGGLSAPPLLNRKGKTGRRRPYNRR